MWSCYAVRFKCKGCSESFNIHSKRLIEKEKVICSNCDSEIPEEIVKNLKLSLQHASQAFVYAKNNVKGLEFDFIAERGN